MGIVGMGGIGKTTLVMAIFNSISQKFDYCCFVADVNAKMRFEEHPADLRNKIISNMYTEEGKWMSKRTISIGLN